MLGHIFIPLSVVVIFSEATTLEQRDIHLHSLHMHLVTDDQDVHMRQQTLKVSLKMLYVEMIVGYSLR